MTKILLVRHGETTYNVEGRIQGWTDSDLTQHGIETLKATANLICDKYYKVYSSSSIRAILSAVILCQSKSYIGDIYTLHELKEINLKPWEGQSIEELKKLDFPHDYITYKSNPSKFIPVAGESLLDVQARMRRAIEKIAKENNDTVLIVSHGAAISSLINYYKGDPLDDIWKYNVTPASVTELFFEEDKFVSFGKIAYNT